MDNEKKQKIKKSENWDCIFVRMRNLGGNNLPSLFFASY